MTDVEKDEAAEEAVESGKEKKAKKGKKMGGKAATMSKEDKELAQRRAAVEQAVAGVEKEYGRGSIMRLGDARAVMNIEVIPSGSLLLDRATGIGGLPRGRVVEIFGPEAAGKTTIALHAIANLQKQGEVACFIDAEHALDPRYAKSIGVNMDDLYLSQPDYGEQGLDIAERMIRSGAVGIVVVDSVAALTPKVELEGEMGDSHVGLQARMMGQALRKLAALVGKTKTTLIFINQLRMKIGVMFGNPETTPGGRGLPFYASMRLDIRRIGSVATTAGSEVETRSKSMGNKVRIKVVKNKLAPPFQEAETEIIFGKGFNINGELMDLGVEAGVIDKSGAWYSYDGERLGQGKDNSILFLKENLEMYEEVMVKVKEAHGIIDGGCGV